jgi:hypothetical protein
MQPVDVERARRRAAHLRKRAQRRPIGSNGRRKDVAAADALEAEASRMDALQQGLATARARELGLWTPPGLLVPDTKRAATSRG